MSAALGPLVGLASAGMESRWGLDDEIELPLEEFVRAVEASPHNLVSKRARSELRERHVVESVALARMLPTGPAALLDVGSGGGFPGMVIAIVRPDLKVTLLDSTRKKTDFLTETARSLALEIEVINARAEEALADRGGAFDLVTARAVAPLDRLVGWTVPFLRPGGLCYAVKGERWAEEIEEAGPALRRHGASIVHTPADDPQHPDEDAPHRPRVVIIASALARGSS